MASGLTHILLTRKLQGAFEEGKLKNILALASDSFQVGAVGPDLPYASIADNDFFFKINNKLADKFHYEQTNQISLRSFKKLKSLKGSIDEEIHFHMFAFFMGYLSHVLADGIIHPFVRDKVGDYKENKAEHRSLEMQLDVLFYEELNLEAGFKAELNYANFHDQLKNFAPNKASNEIIQTFSDLIFEVYNERYSNKKIFGWITGLHRMFEIAEGEHPRIYRKLKMNSFTYKNREDIDRDKAVILRKPKDRDLNFLKIDEIDFFKHCIPQYCNRFVEVAQKAYNYVFENGIELNETDIPPINLDTGRLIEADDLNLIPEFWKNKN